MDANCTSKRRKVKSMETVYIAGGCLWGVQHFFDTVPGVRTTEAGRANGTTNTLDGPYDGYAECVKVVFDEKCTSVTELMEHLFEIIDPYSLNKQGVDSENQQLWKGDNRQYSSQFIQFLFLAGGRGPYFKKSGETYPQNQDENGSKRSHFR